MDLAKGLNRQIDCGTIFYNPIVENLKSTYENLSATYDILIKSTMIIVFMVLILITYLRHISTTSLAL